MHGFRPKKKTKKEKRKKKKTNKLRKKEKKTVFIVSVGWTFGATEINTLSMYDFDAVSLLLFRYYFYLFLGVPVSSSGM